MFDPPALQFTPSDFDEPSVQPPPEPRAGAPLRLIFDLGPLWTSEPDETALSNARPGKVGIEDNSPSEHPVSPVPA